MEKILRVLIQKVKLLLICLIVTGGYAEQIGSIVEFFSYKCSHCANINLMLDQYVNTHQVKFFAVNVDNTPEAMNANIAYYVAVDAGVGQQFKSTYFAAVANGMPAYTPQTLSFVIHQIQNKQFETLLKDPNEKTKVKTKYNMALELLNTYPIQATPSFLINGNTLLEGEDFVRSLY